MVGVRGCRARDRDRPLAHAGLAARRTPVSSDALLANAFHFGSDLAGTVAVLAGLIAAAAGYPGGDSVAALFVAALVLVAAARLMRRNVDVLMDRAPADAVGPHARRSDASSRPSICGACACARQRGARSSTS